MRSLPPSGRVARRSGGQPPAAISRPGVLGPAPAGLRRSGRARADRRTRSGGPRRQPNRPHFYGRRLRRFSLLGASRCWDREPVALDPSRRRPVSHGRSGDGGGPVRASRQPPSSGRVCRLQRVPRPGARGSLPRAGLGRPGGARIRSVSRRACPSRRARPAPAAALFPRDRILDRAVPALRDLPPEPAEHVHWKADSVDVAGGAREGSRRCDHRRSPQ